MKIQSLTQHDLKHPQSQSVFQRVKVLVGSYLGLSVLTLIAIVLWRDNPNMVTQAVWIRASIVVASAVLTISFTAQMARGSSRGYLRLRIVSAIMLVAIVVIIALPDPFPLWMKIEQGVCGLLLLGVVVLVNGKYLRSVFATR